MREKRMNMGYVVDQLVDEMLGEAQGIMDRKAYNLNISLLKKVIQMSVCRGVEEGLNLSGYYTPARFRPGFTMRKQTAVGEKL